MKLVILNTWGKCGPYQKRWNYFLEELDPLKPDLLCLQEVVDDELARMIQKRFGFKHSVSDDKAGLLTVSRFPIIENKILVYQCSSPSETKDERRAIILLPINRMGDLS